MKTLKLTHEELSLLLRALGIAEQQAAEIRKKYIETLVNVRGVENLTETAKETDNLFELETKFADLLIDIKKGGKDV